MTVHTQPCLYFVIIPLAFAACILGCIFVRDLFSGFFEDRKRKREPEGIKETFPLIRFYGPYDTVGIAVNMNTLDVDLHGRAPPDSAKAFWNACMTVVGRPPLFPTAGSDRNQQH